MGNLPAPEDVQAYVVAGSNALNIDWRVPDTIIRYEGGYDPNGRGWTTGGDAGQSFGPFQDYLGGGLGNAMLRDGIDPRDRERWQDNVDWNLNYIASHYDLASLQSQWHGARDNPNGAAEFVALFRGDPGGGGSDGPVVTLPGGVSVSAIALLFAVGVGVILIGSRRG